MSSPDALAEPTFLIDPLDDSEREEVGKALGEYHDTIAGDPEFALASLRRFLSGESDTSEPEPETWGLMWASLTSTERATDYDFDGETSKVVMTDPQMRQLRGNPEKALALRGRRLEIYLERLVAYRKALGQASIEAAE